MRYMISLIIFIVGLLNGQGFCVYATSAETKCVQAALEKDLSKTEIYKLKNGLTVYLSQNKLSPQIVAQIAVRAGAIDEPMDKTGMAHYLEHLMFKGSENIGTTNYTEEKVYLDEIEKLYIEHETEVDTAKRNEIYKKIDQLSAAANEYTVSNDYDRLLASCGATDVNAYTSIDCTVYMSTIPNNQLKNYLSLEYDRFRSPVFRGFHTELETVFEEWNMSQDEPGRRLYGQFIELMYPNTRLAIPVIGTADALQNPSPKKVMDFYKSYYVPENMCIALAGDLDTVYTLKVIEDTFGRLPAQTAPIRKPLWLKPFDGERTVQLVTKQMPFVSIYWRFPAEREKVMPLLYMVTTLLQGNSVGALDQQLMTDKKVASISAGFDVEHGMGTISISVTPLVGQSTQEAFKLLETALNEAKLTLADPEKMKAICTHYKLNASQQNYSNSSRVANMVDAFINKDSWENEVAFLDHIRAIQPRDVMLFVKEKLNDSRYIIFAEKGEFETAERLDKPAVTPLKLNKEAQSAYQHPEKNLAPLTPVYPDLKKEIVGFNTPIEFVPNQLDDTFSLSISFPYGTNHDPYIGLACSYVNQVGTQKRSFDVLKNELYRLGGRCSVSASSEKTVLHCSGLHENSDSIIALGLELLTMPLKDNHIAEALGKQMIKSRELLPTQPRVLATSVASEYLRYGQKNNITSQLSDSKLATLTAGKLLESLKKIYVSDVSLKLYAPDSKSVISNRLLNSFLDFAPMSYMPRVLLDFERKPITENRVYLVNIPNMQQTHILRYIRTAPYNPNGLGLIEVFNQYYGQSMSSVTFQTLRETQSLCYACVSSYILPGKPNDYCGFVTYLSTQNQKVSQAIEAAVNLGFPINEKKIDEIKKNILESRATERIWGAGLFGYGESLKRYKLPLDHAYNVDQQVRTVTSKEMLNLYTTQIANKPAAYCIIGDMKQIDIESLKKYGELEHLSVEALMPPKE